MRTFIAICCSLAMLEVSARAGIIYSPSNPINATITDGSAVGWSGTATASGYRPVIGDVRVNLNISGGFNGDLYAYLSYGGVLVPLLNRAGVQSGDAFGYGDTGFNITLSSTATYDVHFYGDHSPIFSSGQLTGTWQPDGRRVDPQQDPSNFTTSNTRVNFAGAYGGMNPNGTWTLFVSDLSSGATSQLVSWSLSITPVPEPVNVALGIFGGVFLVCSLAKHRRVRQMFR